VARGGGWYTVPRDLRSAERYHVTTDGRRDDFGFRLGRTITGAAHTERVMSDNEKRE
jgi:hypothetical protein